MKKRMIILLLLLLSAINGFSEKKVAHKKHIAKAHSTIAPKVVYVKDTTYPADKIDSIKALNYLMFRVDAELYFKNKEFRKREWEEQYKILDQNFKRYKAHGENSDIIFWVVISIVALAMVFSGIQFYISFHANRQNIATTKSVTKNLNGATPNEGGGQTIAASTIKIGKDGIEVSSSILGVIILVISIAFFYLYLTIVYPLKTEAAFSGSTTTTSAK